MITRSQQLPVVPAVVYVCAAGTPWDPVAMRTSNIVAMAVAIKHGESAIAEARVAFPFMNGGVIDPDLPDIHIAAVIGGQLRHLFNGTVVKSPVGRVNSVQEVQYQAKTDDSDDRLAIALQPITNDPVLYMEQFNKASSPSDAKNILAATTRVVNWDRLTRQPYLVSGFGDPNKLRILGPGLITDADFDVRDNGTAPRGCLVTLQLSWDQRRVAEHSFAGDIVEDAIRERGQRYNQFLASYTYTPDVLDGWPEPGDVVAGSYVVQYSSLKATRGPGVKPKKTSSGHIVKVNQAPKMVAGLPKSAADLGSSHVAVGIEGTDFSQAVLGLYGVQTKKRRELIQIYVPNRGQVMVAGHGPMSDVSLSADNLTDDDQLPEWQSDVAYQTGDVVQANGVPWVCNIPHVSGGSLLEDRIDYSPLQSGFLENKWDPAYQANGSPFGEWDVEYGVYTDFGRRALQHAVRRGIVDIAFKMRTVEISGRAPLSALWDVDPSYTLRVESRSLKGGHAEGKVTDLELSFDGRTGNAEARFTISCCIGTGGADDYEEPDYGEDEDGEPNEPGEGDEEAVAQEGGDWDRVKYRNPIYAPVSMSYNIGVKARVEWLGCEQEYALRNPGVNVPDYYHDPSGGTPYPYRYVPSALNDDSDSSKPAPQEFLDQYAKTKIELIVKEADESGDPPVPINVVVTYGWNGPRQVEL